MNSLFERHFSLASVQAEAMLDRRIHLRALDVFIARETTNSWLAQFIFLLVGVAGYYLDQPFVVGVAAAHVIVDQAVRYNLDRLSAGLAQGELDTGRLAGIERLFLAVGFVWAMAAWPFAEGLDGLRMLLTVVSAAGLLVMANTTCFAPNVFRSAVIGYGAALAVVLPLVETMPRYVFGGAVAAFLVVVTGVGAGTARQLVTMLRMQIERDEAIEGQERTIVALDAARVAATRLAETDSLTGLPNRSAFMTKLDELVAEGRPISLTLLDVDLFKNVNDAFGHAVGDEVLRVVARVLGALEEQGYVSARLGGDEFALVACLDRGAIGGAAAFATVVRQIDTMAREEFDLPPISMTGGSASCPKDATTRSDLLAAADIAQREAKRRRRGAHLDYDATLSDEFWNEAHIAHAIGRAIEARELFLCFQPKIDLQTGRVEGAEALSRFSTPDLAGHSLDEIFRVAAKRGLGLAVDELVLDRYREDLVRMRIEHSIVLPTSVNLSGAILKAPERLMAKLKALLADGVQPSLVRLEITENAIYGRGQDGVIELLDRIVALGFTLALDDFGTGSGTLRHLVSLPICEIKIDRSFVAQMLVEEKSMAIIHALAVMGREMRFDIVAEGVEEEAQAAVLRDVGAQYAQGYLWAKPLPLGQFAAFARISGAGPCAHEDRVRLSA